MSTTFTRAQFQAACKAYVAKYTVTLPPTPSVTSARGWVWDEHPLIPGLGFLSRTVLVPRKTVTSAAFEGEDDLEDIADENMVEIGDTVTSCPIVIELLTSRQWVVFSPTFQTPTFYFAMHHTNGSPLSLTEIMSCTLLRPHNLPGTEATTYGISEPGSVFPLLSQGEHPVLGTPCWYFHPCHSSEAVDEVMKEFPPSASTTSDLDKEFLVKWMEVWFMVLAQVVDLNAGEHL